MLHLSSLLRNNASVASLHLHWLKSYKSLSKNFLLQIHLVQKKLLKDVLKSFASFQVNDIVQVKCGYIIFKASNGHQIKYKHEFL